MRRTARLALGLVVCVACSTTVREEMDTAVTVSASASGTSGTDSATSLTGTGTSGDTASGTTDDTKYDVGDGVATQTGGDNEGMGCKGIDFLFVIDNSGSMSDEQQNLVNSFPGFVASIESKLTELEASNFHILITDTDAATIPPPNPFCSFECTMNPMGVCSLDQTPCQLSGDPNCLITCTSNANAMCANGLNCADLVDCDEECDCELGAGKVKDPDGTPCGVAGMQRYMVDGQPDLSQTFECIAEVGTEGSGNELQVQSLVAALSNQQNDAGGCNEAFLRDDAILVTTLITDEEDSASPGGPPGWKQSVLAAKKNDEKGIVMLGLVGDANTPNAVCTGFDGNAGGEESPRLREFVSSFDNHVLGSVCEPDYSSFFQQAVDLIQSTCKDYVPPQG